MAVETLKSVQVTNADATPPTTNANNLTNGRIKRAVGFVEAGAAADIASKYRLVRVHSSWCVDRVLISCDALGVGCLADIGIYDVAEKNSGAVIDVDFFASAIDIAAALTHSDVTHEADPADAAAGYGKADCEKSLYTALGLTEHKWLDVVATLTAATVAGGTLVCKVMYLDGN